jgi:hypothetical protein
MASTKADGAVTPEKDVSLLQQNMKEEASG